MEECNFYTIQQTNTTYLSHNKINNLTSEELLPSERKNLLLSLFPHPENLNEKTIRSINSFAAYPKPAADLMRLPSPETGIGFKVTLPEENGSYRLERYENDTYLLTDEKEGQGTKKVVKTVIGLNEPQTKVRLTTPRYKATLEKGFNQDIFTQQITKEIEMHRLFSGKKVFVEIYHARRFLCHKGYEKYSIIADRCDKGDLKEFIKRFPYEARTKEENRLLSIFFKDILLALVEMDKKGVHHRDMKPDNVVLTNDGRAKVTDFGYAIFVDEERAILEGSGDKKFPCNVLYLAPENWIGFKMCLGGLKLDIQKRVQINLNERKLRGYQRILDMPEKEAVEMGSTTKGDLLAVGYMLFEVLRGKDFYNNMRLLQVLDYIYSLTQDEFDEKCNEIIPRDEFEEGMLKALKKIMILDYSERPSAIEVYEKYLEALPFLKEI